MVVGSTGANKRLSGHPAGPVLGWVARIEYPVPNHYTCQYTPQLWFSAPCTTVVGVKMSAGWAA